jgi:beta-mannosidase
MLMDGESLVARNRLVLPRFCELEWRPAMIEVFREGDFVVFGSEVFVWGVCLDLTGVAVADNFFDVYPQIPYRIPWPRDRALPSLRFLGNLMPAVHN